MRAHFVHALPDDDDDYGCGAHTAHHDQPAPSKGVQEWQDRHGSHNPVTGALHPKADSLVQEQVTWPTRSYQDATHSRFYEVIAGIRQGTAVHASRRVIDGIDERRDPDFLAMLRFLRSPEWQRAKRVQQLYPATKGNVANRQSHGVDVALVAGTMALQMGMNPWLAAAAGLAHDPGHAMFAHKGEETLDDVMSTVRSSIVLALQSELGDKNHLAFSRAEFDNLRLLDSGDGEHGGFGHASAGASLVKRSHIAYTDEAADAIARHSWSLTSGMSPESVLVSLADRIAYVSSDLCDVLNVGVVPLKPMMWATPKVFQLARMSGTQFNSLSARLGPAGITDAIRTALTVDVIRQFRTTNEIGFSPLGAAAIHELRTFIPERTFRRPGHQKWQNEQGQAVEVIIETLATQHRRRGASADESLTIACAQAASMDDETGYRTAEEFGFGRAAALRMGPPTEEARVLLFSRPGSRKARPEPLPALADVLPVVEVADAYGRVGRMTVPEALLALRTAEFLPDGKVRTLVQDPGRLGGEDFAPTVEVPGRGTEQHERFVAEVRQAIVASVAQGVHLHRRVSRRHSIGRGEKITVQGVDALLKADPELPRALAESDDLVGDDRLCDITIKACEAYQRQYFSRQRPAPAADVDYGLQLMPGV